MEVIQKILAFLNTQWETPKSYGTFHISFLIATVLVTILLCFLWKKKVIKNPQKVILVIAIIVLIFEIYKQIVLTFGNGTSAPSYQWWAFPWQFCSTPLYIGLLAGLTKGKMREHFDAYLATYALFAGLAVMLYPGDVFNPTLGICIQTMICHGSMVVVAAFLYYTGYVKSHINTLWKAIPVFAITLGFAITLNEVAYFIGITENNVFNMFFISRHFDSTLPVYSLVHNGIMASNPNLYPFCVVIYLIGFTLVALIMLSIPMAIRKFNNTDFDARYAELDQRRLEEARIRAEKRAALEAHLDDEIIAKEEAKAQKEQTEE